MSDLKNLIKEAKSSLQDLDELLQRAKCLDHNQTDEIFLNRDEVQRYFEEIVKTVERLPENLKIEESLIWKEEVTTLHKQMEEVHTRVAESLGRVETAWEKNLQKPLEEFETLSHPVKPEIQEGQLDLNFCQLRELLEQGKSHFAQKNFEDCIKKLTEALKIDPANPDVTTLINEAKKKWEDQRLEEELVIHIENLKKEAMNHFDKEEFKESVGMFKFLCELEPQNRTLHDYLQLSWQKVQELEEATSCVVEVTESMIQPPAVENPYSGKRNVEPKTSGEEAIQQSESNHANEITGQTSSVDRDGLGPSLVSQHGSPLQNSVDEKQPIADEMPVSGRITGKRLILSLVSAVLLLTSFLGVWWNIGSQQSGFGNVDIESVPDGAQVWMNGELRGQTQLQLRFLSPGQYDLRIEKDGYVPITREVVVEKGQAKRVTVQLQELNVQPNHSPGSQELAVASFEKGDFLEANHWCDALLKLDPQHALARGLKERIRVHFLEQGRQALRRGKWEVARKAFESVLQVSPQDPEALRQLQKIHTTSDRTPEVASNRADVKGTIEELRKRIDLAITSGNYLPPTPGNALEMIRQLLSLSENDTFAKEKMDTLRRDLLTQAQRTIQAKDWDTARDLLKQMQPHFAESLEVRTLLDKLKVEEVKHSDDLNALILKVESALTLGRLVTPASENALAYCNRILGLDPSNQKALNLKKESLAKAVAQAVELVEGERFEEAQEVYSALLHLSQFESRVPSTIPQLKAELEKLDFSSYPVLHDHAFGNCTGRLRLNGYVFTFVPSGESRDGFSARLEEISVDEPGDNLKIQLRNKTYRFQPNLGKNKEENREKVKGIYQELRTLGVAKR